MRSKIVTAGLCALALVVGATAAKADVSGLFYQEVEQNGRVYVFNTPERLHSFQQSGDIGTAVTLIGKAEGGKTLVGENETAVDMYLFKHSLPGYDRPTPQAEKPSKYPETKIQGRFYGDVTSREIKNDDGSKSDDSGVGIDVKRFYFTVTHAINETWSAQFQSDIGDVGTKRYDVFVKKAYLQGKLSDAITLRLGSADTPWIPFEEGQYGMRYFEQTQVDSLGFGTSASWGLHMLGKLAGGKVDYQVSATNGRSYSDPKRNATLDWEGRVSFKPIGGLVIGVGGYTGKLGKDTKTNSPAMHTAERLNALINYKTDRFGIGGSYYEAKNWKNVTTVETDKADGYSIWAHFMAKDDLKIFGRYDSGNPSKDLAPDKELTYYNVGIEKKFNKVLSASLAYKYADTKGGGISTGNGSIGEGSELDGKYQEIGVWAVYNF